MQFVAKKQGLDIRRPSVPSWIRDFSYQGWTNVFKLVPNNENLYPEALRSDWKSQFNDWNSRILLLAKDGCPTRVIQELRDKGEPQPWRYSQRELGDEGGWTTNNRLYRFASVITGGKLYGSATAHMLYDNPGWSRSLPGFFGGPLHQFLNRVLCWVLESMPRIEWVACLGNEAWFLTCVALGNPSAAGKFTEYRDARAPVAGRVGNKKIAAFPLYHPAARGNAINEMPSLWQAFRTALTTPLNEGFEEKDSSAPRTASATLHRTSPMPRNDGDRKPKSFTTATLPRRQCRVRFMLGQTQIHVSPQYNSGNTWAKIIAYARSRRGGAPANLPSAAVAIPQIRTYAGWIDTDE